MAFYEERLNKLANAFQSLAVEWENLQLQCSPVAYDETADHSGVAQGVVTGTEQGAFATPDTAGVYSSRYQETVLQTYSGTTYRSGIIDRWTPACSRKANNILQRGRQIIEAYDAVYKAYESYAVNSLQVSRMMYRQLPSHVP